MQGLSKTIMIFDFDGVLCNSIDECMLVSLQAYRSEHNIKFQDISDKMKTYFYKYRYLVRPAGEYYLLWKSFFEDIKDIEIEFDNLKKDYNLEISVFRSKFFYFRSLMKKNETYWNSLHKLYKNTLQFFELNFENQFILTNKDKDSVIRLAKYHGYHDKIQSVYSSDISDDKSVLFQTMLDDYPHLFEERKSFYYIDDSVQNLEKVHASYNQLLDITCIEAAWGYSTVTVSASYAKINNILDIKHLLRKN